MDPEIKRQLEEIHALVKDDHHVLRSVRRHQLFETFGKYVLWIIILGSSAYWFQSYVQPLVAKFSATTGMQPSGLFGLPTSADLQKLINSFTAGQK